jgi:hypothetical protein
MELPDDVLLIVKAFAKPSNPYKMYLIIQKILLHGMFLDMREILRRKLKKATQLHFERFLPLFLDLEKRHEAAQILQNPYCDPNTTSTERMEYYSQIRDLTLKKRDLIIQLKEL